ncbi:MAG: glycosyltransferase family 39 protein [Bdellovibrionales bacterium]|nr:glycosyltransferase family 39 protein [Bdellovibrionales bacterium]
MSRADAKKQAPRRAVLLAQGVWLIALLLAACWLFQCTIALQHAPVNSDAGFYLSVARDLNSGEALYRDVAVGYTPFGLYVLAAWQWLLGPSGGYGSSLLLIFLAELFCGLLFFFTLKPICRNTAARAALSATLLCFFYSYEGVYIVLEPLVVAAMLCTLLLLQRGRSRIADITAGAFAVIAFLTKQYGLVCIPAGLGYLIAEKNGERYRQRIVWFIVGAILPAAVFFIMLAVLPHDIRLRTLHHLAGGSYAGETIPSPGFFKRIALDFLFLLLLPFMGVFSRSLPRPTVAFWGVVSLLLVPTLIFQQFLHYVLLLIPGFLALGATILDWAATAPRRPLFLLLAKMLLAASLAFSLVRMNQEGASFRLRAARADQEGSTAAVCGLIPPMASAVIFADPSYFYRCRLKSVFPAEWGYTFLPNLPVEVIERSLNKATVVIVDPHHELYSIRQQERLAQNGIYLSRLLHEQFLLRSDPGNSSLDVWQRRETRPL